MITLCRTCGTSYEGTPERCAICEDERQYVPASGQAWIDYATVTATHANKWQQLEPQLFSIKTVPAFAINQRALLLRTPHGNILWDCIANLDPATQTLIAALGGLRAIAISHPHYYTTMQEWAAAFDAPVYLHASDSEWVMRDSPAIHFWEGDALEIVPSVTLLRLGGHFAGGTVLHWQEGEGVLLAGIFCRSPPGKMPCRLCGATRICFRCLPVRLRRSPGAWWANLSPVFTARSKGRTFRRTPTHRAAVGPEIYCLSEVKHDG
jgi:hypothetical protein